MSSDENAKMSWMKIPAHFLNLGERVLLSSSLDERLIREAVKTNLPRCGLCFNNTTILNDYRGLGQLMGFDADFIRKAKLIRSPTEELLFHWETKNENTIELLLGFLEQLERYDVIDDFVAKLEKRRVEILDKYNRKVFDKTDIPSYGLKIVSRKEWGALPARELKPLQVPVKLVIIHHTGRCKNKDNYAIMRELQHDCMYYSGSFDIGFNFIINEEGTVLEGTGWDIVCRFAFQYSRVSLSFALLGDFAKDNPSPIMMENLNLLIKLAVELNYLESDYAIYALEDVSIGTSCPGVNVIDIISQWPKYRASGEVRDFRSSASGFG